MAEQDPIFNPLEAELQEPIAVPGMKPRGAAMET